MLRQQSHVDSKSEIYVTGSLGGTLAGHNALEAINSSFSLLAEALKKELHETPHLRAAKTVKRAWSAWPRPARQNLVDA
ncbi:MAG: hypothetical protein ACRD4P_03735 [Bryobacteraceae bacterium]